MAPYYNTMGQYILEIQIEEPLLP